ncbi:CopG family ribbon-helix-helix protein [Leptolyngbya sp. PL-A3]|uniref:CopG family ribbon-helix-helix protein n=1 Tax=Leptolyngbya sp. PL-A3 TaxID=2933911 RepID=UPI0032990301
MSQSEVVTVRLAPKLKAKLDALAESTNRSKSWLAAQAIEQYIEQQLWQIQRIEEALALAESDNAHWVEGDSVEEWLHSWGTKDEKPVPCE